MKLILEHVNVLLIGECGVPNLKSLCLKLLLLLVTACDDLADNPFLQHAMTFGIFEELVQVGDSTALETRSI